MHPDIDVIRSRLVDFGIPIAMVDQICERLDKNVVGVLMYGSWARHDAGPESDLDILILTNDTANYTTVEAPPKLSVSRYTRDQLQGAAETLFGMHLARDGVIVYDEHNQLETILKSFSAPNPRHLIERVRKFSLVFDIPNDELTTYLVGLCKLARYLLRSTIYAIALEQGAPCFSVRELSERFNDPSLATILSSHPGVYPAPSAAVLDDLLLRLRKAVGEPERNPFGTIHSLIVGYWDDDPELAQLATLALGSGDALPYSEIPKVVL
ncbi:nucleotidyltransferase domain-containing protein [Mycolicibacterium neoaurum]|uniref:nucleotidyltransferase domain-containing protein n=2 Tax=Mycolicibacterium neoaurum TaxID=1795 RepID=UPI001F4C6B52|nr:nucleotidyltransferase domain-containing protein [Mycolicibacterium neoaurum]